MNPGLVALLANRGPRTSSEALPLPTLSIDNASPATVAFGGTLQLTYTASDSAVPTWSSSNTAVVTVDANGLVTHVAAGSATVTATHPTHASVTDSIAVIASAEAASNPPTASFVTSVDHATGVITATPTFAAGDGETVSTATLGLYSAADALLEEDATLTTDVAVVFGSQADGTYVVKLLVVQSDDQSKLVTATIVIDSTAPVGLVVYSDPKIEFIIGPQTVAGDGLVDGSSTTTTRSPWPWWDKFAVEEGLQHADTFLAMPSTGYKLTGTVTRTQGSAVVTGSGTLFTTEVTRTKMHIWNPATGTLKEYTIASVDSDTQITLTETWNVTTASGLVAWVVVDGSSDQTLSRTVYYDLALCLYQLAYRTGDAAHFAKARAVVEHWWGSIAIAEGANRSIGSASQYAKSSRDASPAGIMIRALEEGDSSEKWGWLAAWTEYQFEEFAYDSLPLPNLAGMRDAAYMLLFATQLCRVLPDSFPDPLLGTTIDGAAWKAAHLPKLIELAVGTGVDVPNSYWRRLQQDTNTTKQNSIGQKLWLWLDGQHRNAGMYNEPWHTGLLLHALEDLDRLLEYETGYATERAEIQAMILDAADAIYNLAYRRSATQLVYSDAGDADTAPTPLDGTTCWRGLSYGMVSDGAMGRDGHLVGTALMTNASAAVVGTGTEFLADLDYAPMPFQAYRRCAGGVSVTNNSDIVTGVGTTFLTDYEVGCRISIERPRGFSSTYIVKQVNSDTELEIWGVFQDGILASQQAGGGAGTATNLVHWRQLPNKLPGLVSLTNGSKRLDAVGFNFNDHYSNGDIVWCNTTYPLQTSNNTYPAVWSELHNITISADGTYATSTRTHVGATMLCEHSDIHGGYHIVSSVADDTNLTLARAWPHATEGSLILDVHNQNGWTTEGDNNKISERRYINGLVVSAMGYCYKLTGNTVWKDRGDEMFSSQFGRGVGPGADGFYGSPEFEGKTYSQCYRYSHRYLARRLGA